MKVLKYKKRKECSAVFQLLFSFECLYPLISITPQPGRAISFVLFILNICSNNIVGKPQIVSSMSETGQALFYIYIYLVDKVPQDITSTVPNIYAHMHKLDKKDN